MLRPEIPHRCIFISFFFLMAPFECRNYQPVVRETHLHRTVVGISSTLRSLCIRNDTVCLQDLVLSCAKNGIFNIYSNEVILLFINLFQILCCKERAFWNEIV
jgi:hypothetical protein